VEYTQAGDAVALTGCPGFNAMQTLESGQCFRFERLSEEECHIIALSRSLFIRQDKNITFFYKTNVQEFQEIWIPFFDLGRDYRAVKETLAANDSVMRGAIEYAGGVHILRQDPWECLVSFIVSQNNNIPRIRRIMDTLAKTYGRPLEDGAHAFPSPEELASATLDGLLKCNTGFRAKYVMGAAKNALSGAIGLGALRQMGTEEARAALMDLKGVGGKIADCVLLFAYGRHGVFPTDVWIKRAMEHFYFGGQSASFTAIHKLAESGFGAYAGFVQQYQYVYKREFLKNL